MDTVLTVRLSLDGVTPEIWRRLEVPSAHHLGELHLALNAAMGWFDYHLHAFEVAGRRYGVPDLDFFAADDDTLPEEDVIVGDLARAGVAEIEYEYDFGDGWRCHVSLESEGPLEEGAFYPRCIGGERAGPPEDCGGLPGFASFVEAMADPRHPDHDDLTGWYGGDFDPEEFSAEAVSEVMRQAATGGPPDSSS